MLSLRVPKGLPTHRVTAEALLAIQELLMISRSQERSCKHFLPHWLLWTISVWVWGESTHSFVVTAVPQPCRAVPQHLPTWSPVLWCSVFCAPSLGHRGGLQEGSCPCLQPRWLCCSAGTGTHGTPPAHLAGWSQSKSSRPLQSSGRRWQRMLPVDRIPPNSADLSADVSLGHSL